MALEELQGRVAVVTGAGSGVGAAAARVLAQAGMRVAVADRDEATAGEVAEAIRRAGGEAHSFVVDVGEVESIQELASSTRSTLGDSSVVLANVGVNQVRKLERSSSHDCGDQRCFIIADRTGTDDRQVGVGCQRAVEFNQVLLLSHLAQLLAFAQ